MDAERWRRLEAICDAALERPAESRDAYVAEACAGDDALAAEVMALLAELERRPAFLEQPLVDAALAVATAATPAEAGASVGPYRIVRRLGHGGMGEVYLATRRVDDVEQTVALKVIRRGMATDDVLSRFRQERRILASLDHPNIARLLDVGATDDDRPYFVMEYVDGEPIDGYCRARALPVDERLRLFRTVCDAVHHAHQSLVVHRDIKPGNILVTAAGVPKLLDFGIGKVLATADERSGPETASEVRLLTPDYAAPEQIRGEPVTTATDVFGLGVLLYELLTDRHPHRTGDEPRLEIERAILDRDPPLPSAAVSLPGGRNPSASQAETASRRRRLTGDLDNIVLRAMRKAPERRYVSAAALADDVRRHLDGLPVSARPDTAGYRLRKFVGRHRAGVAAGAIVAVALVATTVVTVAQSRRATREAARAIRERDKAVEIRGFLMEMFGATGGSNAVGDTISVRRLLDLQTASLDQQYPAASEVKAEMLEVLADGYDRLGLYRAAEPLAQRALTMRRELVDSLHPDVATALNLVGWIAHELGRSAEAVPILAEAVTIRRAAGPPHRRDLSRSLNDLGVVYNALQRYDSAETVLREALEVRRAEFGPDHRAVGITANNLAAALYFQGRHADAATIQEEAVRALEASVGRDHQRTIVALSNAAAMRRVLGDWDGATEHYRALLERQTRLQGPDHPATLRAMTNLAAAVSAQVDPDDRVQRLAEADSLYRGAIAGLEARLGPDHPEVGTALTGLGTVLNERGQLAEARALLVRAVDVLTRSRGREHQSTAQAEHVLGVVEWRLGAPDEAIRLARHAVAVLPRTAGPGHWETARAKATLCSYLAFERRDLEEAERLCAEAVAALREGPATFRRMESVYTLWQAHALVALGLHERAAALLDRVRPAIEAGGVGSESAALLDSLTRRLASARR